MPAANNIKTLSAYKMDAQVICVHVTLISTDQIIVIIHGMKKIEKPLRIWACVLVKHDFG